MQKKIWLFDQYTYQDNNKDNNDEVNSYEAMSSLLGGKGAGLVVMTKIGLPIPDGFIIDTEVCKAYYLSPDATLENIKNDVLAALSAIEKKSQEQFGSEKTPLLLSVRSGGKASMPGMMDTILNLGLNDVTTDAMVRQTNDERFAYDSYRRFIQMYSNVVLGITMHNFEEILEQYKAVRKVRNDADLSVHDLKEIVAAYKEKVKILSGRQFPQDVHEQLWTAIKAVFKSWMNPRAVTYRKIYSISENAGTAIVVQKMVFGNLGDNSATGVAFTRNPSTGEKIFFGEYLAKAQGEDVVSGMRTPQPLTANVPDRNYSMTDNVSIPNSGGIPNSGCSMTDSGSITNSLNMANGGSIKSHANVETISNSHGMSSSNMSGAAVPTSSNVSNYNVSNNNNVSNNSINNSMDGEKPNTLGATAVSLEEMLPDAFAELLRIKDILELHFKDMQDIEFTIENGKLWILQTRNGKRTAAAGLKIAIDMAAEGLITKQTAVNRVDPLSLNQLLHPCLANRESLLKVGQGLAASPGAAVGEVVFSAEDCVEKSKTGQNVILVREETNPEDIQGMFVAQGILTATGGATSHAAVVARGIGKPCVSGIQNMYVDLGTQTVVIGGQLIKAGDMITIDGSTGEVFLGYGDLKVTDISDRSFNTIISWADGIRKLQVRANAETINDVKTARKFGCEGIGLCRTEHMFFDGGRINDVRGMIIAADAVERQQYLDKIIAMQRTDLLAIFDEMQGLPVTVRLLDPPLHEFLPKGDREITQLANLIDMPYHAVAQRVHDLEETNPMLGNRGCRLGVTSPEIYEAQITAIFEAALSASVKSKVDGVNAKAENVKPKIECVKPKVESVKSKVDSVKPKVEIMIPFISLAREFIFLKHMIVTCIQSLEKKYQYRMDYTIGAMIELPRAALKAGLIAKEADFLSFGTNDLTQTMFGMSRDDSRSFLEIYRQHGLLAKNPFASLDVSGVGEMITLACERARSTNSNIKLGVCGEVGGDPESINFFHKLGLDYISCSPYRVSIAKLAAAQALLHSSS